MFNYWRGWRVGTSAGMREDRRMELRSSQAATKPLAAATFTTKVRRLHQTPDRRQAHTGTKTSTHKAAKHSLIASAEPKNVQYTFSKTGRVFRDHNRQRLHTLILTVLYTLSNIYQITTQCNSSSNPFSSWPSSKQYPAHPTPQSTWSEQWSSRGRTVCPPPQERFILGGSMC